jgi:hypothetical protein
MSLFLTGPLAGTAPWDASAYFQTIAIKHYDLVSANPESLIGADPNRVLLNICIRSSAAQVGVAPTKQMDTSLFIYDSLQALGGFSQAKNRLTLTWGNDGPLVQQEWFAQGGIGDCIVITSMALTRWPDPKRMPEQTIKVPKCPSLKIA